MFLGNELNFFVKCFFVFYKEMVCYNRMILKVKLGVVMLERFLVKRKINK